LDSNRNQGRSHCHWHPKVHAEISRTLRLRAKRHRAGALVLDCAAHVLVQTGKTRSVAADRAQAAAAGVRLKAAFMFSAGRT